MIISVTDTITGTSDILFFSFTMEKQGEKTEQKEEEKNNRRGQGLGLRVYYHNQEAKEEGGAEYQGREEQQTGEEKINTIMNE